MYKPDGLTKLFTKPRAKSRIPKSITAFFITLIFILGIDLGFTNSLNKILCVITKFICGTLSLYITLLFAVPLIRDSPDDMYWVGIVLMQYVLYSIAIRLTTYTFYDFIVDVYNIDEGITKINTEKIGLVLWFYASLLYGSKWLIYYYYCGVLMPEVCEQAWVPWYVYGIFSQGVDLVSVVLILIYYYIYCCAKYLNQLCEKENVKIDLLKRSYIAIANCYDCIRPFYSKMVILELMFEVPKLMGLIWHMLKHFRYEEFNWLGYTGDYVYATHIMSFIFISSLVVQMTKSQVDILNLKLHNIIIEDQDTRRQTEASRLVVYMKARQLQHEVVGLIPVDLRLPAILVNICATYMVVVVQFTHLYD